MGNHGCVKLYFKKTSEFEKEIYELLDGGKSLFHVKISNELKKEINAS